MLYDSAPGADPNYSPYSAAIRTFYPLERVTTPEQFLSLVKGKAASDAPPKDRFKIIEETFQLTTERPYPCVRYSAAMEDLKARTARGTQTLPFHMRALFCQHPTRRDVGFEIIYTQLGGLDPDFDSQAHSFFEGVQVKAQ